MKDRITLGLPTVDGVGNIKRFELTRCDVEYRQDTLRLIKIRKPQFDVIDLQIEQKYDDHAVIIIKANGFPVGELSSDDAEYFSEHMADLTGYKSLAIRQEDGVYKAAINVLYKQ